jgi:tRNA1Val (adenine37-N6)-methyltransferase
MTTFFVLKKNNDLFHLEPILNYHILNPMFTFKQFAIHQDRCAMKVGTDGVLLGAWASVEHLEPCHRILDIGTGTGLIALMAAQRSRAAIVGIDLDEAAVTQATENAACSPWSHRIRMVRGDIRSITHELSSDDNRPQFDALLCNPPYFENALRCPDAQRTMARHTDTLTFDELARSAAELLTPEGELSVVIPFDRAMDMTVSAASHGLFATRQTIVCPYEGAKPKRILMAFSRQGAAHTPETLCIQNAQRSHTPEYRKLVEAFYLKM